MRERTECETVGVPMKGVVLYVYTLYDVEEKNLVQCGFHNKNVWTMSSSAANLATAYSTKKIDQQSNMLENDYHS